MSQENTFNLAFSTESKKYGYWEEVLNNDDSDQKIFNKILKKEIKKAEQFVGNLTYVVGDEGCYGGGESNYDVTYSTTLNVNEVVALLENDEFLEFLGEYDLSIGSNDAYCDCDQITEEPEIVDEILANMGHTALLDARTTREKQLKDKMGRLSNDLKPLLEKYTKEEILSML